MKSPREARSSISEEEREGHGEKGAGAGEGHGDGGIVRYAEGTLLAAAGESQKKADGDPVHLLRHPHGECSASGRPAGGATSGRSRLTGWFK